MLDKADVHLDFSVDFMLDSRRNVCFHVPDHELSALQTASSVLFHAHALLGCFTAGIESVKSVFPPPRTAEVGLLRLVSAQLEHVVEPGLKHVVRAVHVELKQFRCLALRHGVCRLGLMREEMEEEMWLSGETE